LKKKERKKETGQIITQRYSHNQYKQQQQKKQSHFKIHVQGKIIQIVI
jgi:hypothetical protein